MRSIATRMGILAWSATLLILAWGCESNLDSFWDFVKDGETVYVGAADTVLISSGFNKLRMKVAINADPKITKGVLKTIDGSVNHEFAVDRKRNGKDTISFDIQLPEGEYTFGVYLMDDLGNSSVRREVPATVFGEKYLNALTNRNILSIENQKNVSIIQWGESTAAMTRTLLRYEDKNGTMKTVDIPADSARSNIRDYKLGGKIFVRSYFKPTPDAFEEFEAIESDYTFPGYFKLDKSIIAALKLPGDASDGCYGSSYSNLFNNSTSDFWHSCEDPVANANDLYPLIMSFDLGQPAKLARFRLDERASCCGERGPAVFQIWGTNTISKVPTVDIDKVALSEWEKDAAAKGWVKFAEVSGNSQKSFEIELGEITTAYRYVRFVGISSIGSVSNANFSEFTFFGK